MRSTHCEPLIDTSELQMLQRSPETRCIDVRSATEFATGHIPGAISVPLQELETRISDLSLAGRIVLTCKSGTRAEIAYALLECQMPNLLLLEGGTDAWERAGLPLVRSARCRWALERQVRLVAGLIVLTAITMGFWVNELWFLLAGLIGIGLRTWHVALIALTPLYSRAPLDVRKQLGRRLKGSVTAFRAWLAQIARRVCWRLKESESLLPLRSFSELEGTAGEPHDRSAAPDDAVADAELRQMLQDAMASLPRELREIYQMRDIDEIPGEEAAARLNLSLAAMKSRLHRARAVLRTYMETALVSGQTQRKKEQGGRKHGRTGGTSRRSTV